jgi:HEAT repeat protein
LGDAAKAAILKLADPAVNAKLVELLKNAADETQRGRALELVEARNAIAAVEVLLPDLVAENANVRRSAARALGKLAQPKHVSAMLAGLPKAAAGGERDDLEKAIMFVCERVGSPEERAEPLIAVYADAKIDKALLLPVLGRVGGAKAAELVRQAAASDVPEIRKAAVRALCNWPDPSVAKDLEQLAAGKTDPAESGTALRALVRVVTLKSGLQTKEQIAYLKKAMELASTEQDRAWVIDRANNVRHVDVFRMVLPYLDDPKLAVRAGRTICDLAHHGGLKSREKAEYQTALKKIIEVCEKDKGLVNRAKEELEANK